MRVRIDATEWYPVFVLSEADSEWRPAIDLDDEKAAFVLKAQADFEKAQEILTEAMAARLPRRRALPKPDPASIQGVTVAELKELGLL